MRKELEIGTTSSHRYRCGGQKQYRQPCDRDKIKDINMVKKHVKTTKEKKGGIVSKENFIHISNLKLIDERNKSKKTEAKK